MKNACRVLSILFALLFSVSTFASAETIDLSGLSYDELIALKQKLNLAIAQSDEWKQVTVPIGNYIVGEDIPAGVYTVAHAQSNTLMYARVYVYDIDGSYIGYYSINSSEVIGKLILEDGHTVKIELQPVILSPYQGLDF